MGKIRKKTSRRVAIHQREKIKKRAKDSRKKKSKEAKKNPQWKTKHPKDPGIPNNFPYKDQILAEVAEQRRLAAEEKQRRKEEKKAAKAHAEGGEEDAEGSDAEAAFDGVKALSLSAKGVRAAAGAEEDGDAEMGEAEDEEDGPPVLINPDLPNLKTVLDVADVVVKVLDARDPAASRSAHLEELVRGLDKKMLLVLNKVDACPREAVEAWAATLRKEYPTVLFRSATACLPANPAESQNAKGKGKERERTDDAWGFDAVAGVLRRWAEEKQGDEPLTVAVVGITNVGKSSFVNSLLRSTALQTYRPTSATTDSPTTTTHPQEVTVELDGGKQLRVIDTPGLLWHFEEDASPELSAQLRARDILIRNRGRIERLKDPSPVLTELVSRASREDLMLLYNLPIFTDGDANAFLTSVARANGYIKKKGEPDLAGAARMVLRDWSTGKLARYTTPASPPSSTSTAPSDSPLADVYASDDAVLSKLATRKELRKAGGLVKLRPGTIEARKVVLDASYLLSSEDEGMEADEEDAATVDDADEIGAGDDASEGDYVSDEEEGSDELDEEDDADEGDEDEDEDELASPPARGKRKRMVAKAPARPAKRVAFAAEPKGTKQARSAAGAKGAAKAKAKASGKPAAAPKPAKKAAKAAPPKRIANAAPSKKAAAPAKGGEVAYDFKQFF